MSKLTEKQGLIFAQHPTAKGFYFASDDVAFTLENDCINYAKTLANDDYEFIKNPDYKKEIPAGETITTDEVKAPTAKTPSTKKVATKPAVEKTPEQIELGKERELYEKLHGKKANNAFKIEKLKQLNAEKATKIETE